MTTTVPSAIADSRAWEGKALSHGWSETAGGRHDVIEPATGKVLHTVGLANPQDIAEAAKRAKAAQPKWEATPFEERAAILRRAADILERSGDAMKPRFIRETGSVPPKVDFELGLGIGMLREAAALLTQPHGLLLPSTANRMSIGRRVPHGVVGVIAPFNAPMALSTRAVAPALALGNTVVLKPDPQTTYAGGYVLAAALLEAGLPEDCLYVLPGGVDAGEALVTDPNVSMISFTGSTNAGRRVGELASRHLKRVTLELGGKNSIIVFDDADLDVAASNVAWGCYLHQGQICMTTGRVLVQKSIAEEFIKRLAEKAEHLPVGDPATAHVALGPVINQRQLQRIDSIVKDTVAAGATLRAGGSYEGLFYRPTVLTDVKPGMRAYDEEVFGPVTSIVTFETEDEAIALNNDTEYGLSCGVLTKSLERAMYVAHRVKTGKVHINDQTVGDEPWVPFGGMGASGNGGRHGGPANWEEFTQWQWITIQDKATAYPF
ncbi:aldehyde dehydrogenase family protein [Noviherbaspirillum cavernae]|uniref:Aldehyde dehydrogenase family protein n=1 Tax=Noviherbaspirillum cavernae TaxID=2320862 RepID=A0A418WV02_9BURK|nr:benzaldehyde dehydrogenase [Noviherbaspirillum cavernae]RJF96507.1 aldehyde dehydrogenase family protein [Noviherbaspirillum cavernae]